MSRAGENNDSLEMLLDTICNTFGAVLFIAMLVVLLVNPNAEEGSGETDEDVTSEFIELQAEISDMELEAARLRAVLVQQQDLTERFATPDSKQIATELLKAEQEQSQLVEDRAMKTKLLAQVDERNARAREQIRGQRAALRRAEAEVRQKSQAIRKTVAKSSRSAQTPKAMRLRTTPVVTMLKNGVWYCLLKPQAGGLTINRTDCEAIPRGPNQELRPRLGGGVNVRNTNRRVSLPVSGSPTLNHYKVYVHADSAIEYRAVKDAISTEGYKVELVLMSAEASIIYGRGVTARDAWGQ